MANGALKSIGTFFGFKVPQTLISRIDMKITTIHNLSVSHENAKKTSKNLVRPIKQRGSSHFIRHCCPCSCPRRGKHGFMVHQQHCQFKFLYK